MRLSALMIALFVCFIGWLPSCWAQEATNRLARPSVASIDAALAPFVDRGEIAGVVTLVAHQGEIVHLGAVGFSNVESQRPILPGTQFSIASMTKPIVVTAMMILVAEGKLDINDPVSKHIPAFAEIKNQDGTPPSRPLLIRDLVTHTAGLSGPQIFRGSLADHVEQLAIRPLAFDPGTKWSYSPGINVVGRVIEIVSGQPLHTFLQENIFDPLAMTQTTYYPDKRQQANANHLRPTGPTRRVGQQRCFRDSASVSTIGRQCVGTVIDATGPATTGRRAIGRDATRGKGTRCLLFRQLFPSHRRRSVAGSLSMYTA